MNNQDYKLKYQDLKLKFHDAVDCAFRLGMEQGMQTAQTQQAQQSQMAAQQPQPGQEGDIGGGSEKMEQDPGTDGSELDQHIGTLESMLQKSDPTSSEALSLKKSLEGIKAYKNTLKQTYDLKKSEKAISAIGKAMKPAFTVSKSATKNLSEHGKKALNMQEQIVSDLMKDFQDQQDILSQEVNKTLSFEHLLED